MPDLFNAVLSVCYIFKKSNCLLKQAIQSMDPHYIRNTCSLIKPWASKWSEDFEIQKFIGCGRLTPHLLSPAASDKRIKFALASHMATIQTGRGRKSSFMIRFYDSFSSFYLHFTTQVSMPTALGGNLITLPLIAICFVKIQFETFQKEYFATTC